MVDVNFSKTVVLLCQYDEEGALGLVVNRITGLDADKVLHEMGFEDAGGIQGPVHWGGPVQPGAVFLTFARPSASDAKNADSVFELSETLSVSPNPEVIEAVALDSGNDGAFLSLGYAGWGAGQLDSEIESGSWIYMELDADIIFELPPHERWERCINSIGVDPKMIWMQPIDE